MERSVSITLSKEEDNYRRVAKNHYGLSEEQMRGVHVHHNPPRHLGGRNIPEHLYVYSYENHDYVHGGGGFVAVATEGGRKGGEKTAREGKGVHSPEYAKSGKHKEATKKGGRNGGGKNGEKTFKEGKGIHDPKNRELVEKTAKKNREEKSKVVVCVETGTEYPSSYEAGKQNNADPGNIRRSARSGGKLKVGGYHWKRL